MDHVIQENTDSTAKKESERQWRWTYFFFLSSLMWLKRPDISILDKRVVWYVVLACTLDLTFLPFVLLVQAIRGASGLISRLKKGGVQNDA